MADAPTVTKPEERPIPRWIRVSLAVAGVLVLVAIIYVVASGRVILADTDRRNQSDLAAAASGLEQWSAGIDKIARATLIPGRAEPVGSDERDYLDGWRGRAYLRHPVLGEYKLLYTVSSDDRCNAIKAEIAEKGGKLPFVADWYGGGRFLKVVDRFPLADIYNLDTGPRKTGEKVVGHDAYVVALGAGEADGKPDAKSVVCYAAAIPLERLLALDQGARFTTLMVVDADRKIVAQVGAMQPVSTLSSLVPESPVLTRAVQASVGDRSAAQQRERRLADSLDPVEVEIGGRTFVAYVRPFFPVGHGFDACTVDKSTPSPAVGVVEGPVNVAARSDAAAADVSKAGGDCLIVGLVPRATIWRQTVDPPLSVSVAVALVLLLLVALLPSLRLILLGPGEAIGRAEAIAIALGIPAAASLATLIVLYALDIGAARSTADTRAFNIATLAADGAAQQLSSILRSVEQLTRPVDAEDVAGLETLASADASARLPGPARLPDKQCHFWPSSKLPFVDTFSLVDEHGAQAKASRNLACRDFAGGRANVSARDYFQRLRSGAPGTNDGVTIIGRPYVLDHVVSVVDGIPKTIVGMGIEQPPGDGKSPPRQFAVDGAVLTRVVAPILPPPFGLMIVDTRRDDLPVLLHPIPGRSGTERLGALIGAGVLMRLRALGFANCAQADSKPCVPRGDPERFEAFYDGGTRNFVAMPIRGSRRVAVAYYAKRDIDEPAARTAVQALENWAAFSLLFTLLWLLWLWWTGRQGWPRLWPQRGKEGDYSQLTTIFALVAALGVAGALGLQPVAALSAGLVVRFVAALLLHALLKHDLPDTSNDRVLRPATQRAFSLMLVPLILCLSVVPMIGFWREARNFTFEMQRSEIFQALMATNGELAVNRGVFHRLRWAYGIADPEPETFPGAHLVSIDQSKHQKRALAGQRQNAPSISGFFAGWLRVPQLPIPQDCAQSRPDGSVVLLCGPLTNPGLSLEPLPDILTGIGERAAILVSLLVLGLAVILTLITRRVLRSLVGFDRALSAVRLPPLYLEDLWKGPTKTPEGALTLNRKSLLVNAPHILRALLEANTGRRLLTLKVADIPGWLPTVQDNSIVLVTGLELVLADRKRRLDALALLERYAAAVDQPANSGARMIVLSEAAPLERILDAFERDKQGGALASGGITDRIDTERENLRWSRLFESFGTYAFEQQRLIDTALQPDELTGLAKRGLSANDPAAINAVLDECRWLPFMIVENAIGEDLRVSDRLNDLVVIPLDDKTYRGDIRSLLISWAAARKFPGKVAARDHLRSQFIEHYQKLWSSSTYAEHLILHNMAHGRFVNIEKALAFASLVRRGLVVLDPEPRLMNESFAMFVRQAEKLDTINEWRSHLPAGAWVKARLPLLLVIAVPLAGLIGAAALAGGEILSWLPVLAAGAPALVAAARRALRES